jgi:hypothetical protein
MGLVGETGFLSYRGQRLFGPAHQCLCPLDPRSHDVTLWADADRLSKGAAEMIWAEARDFGQMCQGQLVFQMRFDIVADPLQSFATVHLLD